jgi:hypothetical protein
MDSSIVKKVIKKAKSRNFNSSSIIQLEKIQVMFDIP